MKKQLLFILLTFLFCIQLNAQETYKVGNTEYYYGKTYSTTGKPMVKRSESNIRYFLNSKGYTETPKGYEIDHIKPLSEGGTDDPSNMQLISKEQHKRKTASERASNSNSTYSAKRTYNSTYTYPTSPKTNYNGNSTYSNGRTIQTGSRGGQYYINKNGNKTYVKKKN